VVRCGGVRHSRGFGELSSIGLAATAARPLAARQCDGAVRASIVRRNRQERNPHRCWYVDAECGDAAADQIVQLDVTMLDQGQILVARRILGTAEIYVRQR
jgi:hypothetical protein